MVNEVLDIEAHLNPDGLAKDIANKWTQWDQARDPWKESLKETRDYVYATDTKTTSNSKLPWRNTTTTPKLCQIFDNLKANYSYALFPQSQWHKWKGGDLKSREKSRVIEDFMSTKLRDSKFEQTMDSLVDDWILTGNCFGTIEYVTDYSTLPTGEVVENYVGPRLVRISPSDIVFNAAAKDFRSAPKIIRSLYSLGDLEKAIEEGDTSKKEIFTRILANRSLIGTTDKTKSDEGFTADGFGSIQEYYGSGLVEVLTFYGDLYDTESNKLMSSYEIQVVDRAYVLSKAPTESWLGSSPVFHSAWRSRPGNLYGMGPLDNLVGMQYRIDHLENLKADAFDQIAFPKVVIRGSVEAFTNTPGENIIVGEDGDVRYLAPDGSALQADFQISTLEQKMEEFAGAPRQAMGIRTPGEKTAFEVQELSSSASRIFTNKAAKLEKEFIEPALNAMLEASRRKMHGAEEIQTVIEESEAFLTVTQEDIIGKGRIYPVGARHFAESAQRVQTLQQLQALKQDPTVGAHLSGKRMAEIFAEELSEPDLYTPNILFEEQAESQAAAQDAEADLMEQQGIKAQEGL